MKSGTIILVNGTSSSGKSSLCQEFQQVMDEPYMHIDVDAMGAMLPDTYFGEGAERWPKVGRFLQGVHGAVCAFAQTGHNVIVDQIVIRNKLMTDILNIYQNYSVYFVGLFCPVVELERRELARFNRQLGLAAGQATGIHQNKVYDLELDTFGGDTAVCATKLQKYIQSQQPPTAFDHLRAQAKLGNLIGKEDR